MRGAAETSESSRAARASSPRRASSGLWSSSGGGLPRPLVSRRRAGGSQRLLGGGAAPPFPPPTHPPWAASRRARPLRATWPRPPASPRPPPAASSPRPAEPPKGRCPALARGPAGGVEARQREQRLCLSREAAAAALAEPAGETRPPSRPFCRRSCADSAFPSPRERPLPLGGLRCRSPAPEQKAAQSSRSVYHFYCIFYPRQLHNLPLHLPGRPIWEPQAER